MIDLVPVTSDLARAVVTGDDLGDLARVRDWPHPDTADALRALADHPEHCGPGTFLVTEDGVVVGDCGWFGPPDDAGEVEIGYGLAASARGRGLGAQAVQALIAWARAQGATTIRAEVRPGNEASLRLLRGLGFAVVEERAGYLVLRT